MLKKANRLKSSTRIREVRDCRPSWANRWFAMAKCPGECSQSRFAFVTSRRIGNAVVRNRVKRLMRESIRLCLHRIAPGWDVVIIARTPSRDANFQEIADAMQDVLRRAHLVSQEQ